MYDQKNTLPEGRVPWGKHIIHSAAFLTFLLLLRIHLVSLISTAVASQQPTNMAAEATMTQRL